MRPVVARLFVAVVVLGCGGATCLYSGAGPIEAGGPAMRGTWNPALAFIADLLTVPIPTAGIADVRDVALVFTTGVLLILAGVTRSGSAGRSSATQWMGWCAAIVIALSIISAFAWRSFDLSWGWIVRFAAGAAMAIVISHRFTPAMVRQTMAGLLVVAVLALALSIWHRADRGYAHFTWPIGPITITGGLAAVWAALAGIWGVGLAVQRRPSWAIFALGSCGVCLYALQQTERRSPAMGLIAAIVLVAAIAIWRRYPRRAIRVAVFAVLAAIAVGSVGYVVRQARSTDRETSGPIAVRKAYWGQSAKFIGAHPLLGIGPDRFVIDMTMAIAPLRAEMPHVYHGNLDTAAHNEWLQAAVELGLPAGLSYVVLPLGVIFVALRNSHRLRAGATKDLTLALAAALIALAVCEAASINLRGPILPIWYWTLIGLIAAIAKPTRRNADSLSKKPSPNRLRPMLLIASGLACFVVTSKETTSSTLAALPSYGGNARAPLRLYLERTLHGRYEIACFASDGDYLPYVPALELWHKLFDLLPVYRDTAARYAASLVAVGEPIAAKGVLESIISTGLSPYDYSANVLYSVLLSGDPVAQLRCLQRALRSGSFDGLPTEVVSQCQLSPAVQNLISHELDSARHAANSEDASQLRGAAIELLRLHPYLHSQSNIYAKIEELQLAAECYRRLERENNPFRRSHDAEADAFYRLALIIHHGGEAGQFGGHYDLKASYEAIVEAERYAVLGIKHEKLPHPNPAAGFIGGEIVPTEFPARLRPLWNLSATLHMAVGDFRNIDLRILAALPPGAWATIDLDRQRSAYAKTAIRMLRVIPDNSKPSYYNELIQMAGISTSQMQFEEPVSKP